MRFEGLVRYSKATGCIEFLISYEPMNVYGCIKDVDAKFAKLLPGTNSSGIMATINLPDNYKFASINCTPTFDVDVSIDVDDRNLITRLAVTEAIDMKTFAIY